MTKHDYCFELKSKLSELNRLCRYLEDCGDVLNLPQKCIFEINVGLDELFTNIVSYGFDDDLEHQIKFSLAKDDDKLIVHVEDDGVPFNPLDVRTGSVSTDLDSTDIGGLGIHLVKNMMDDIDYKRSEGKNKVILQKSVETV